MRSAVQTHVSLVGLPESASNGFAEISGLTSSPTTTWRLVWGPVGRCRPGI